MLLEVQILISSIFYLRTPSLDSDGWLPRAPIRQTRERQSPLHFTIPLAHSVNGSFFGSSFEGRRNSSSQFAPLPQQRMREIKERDSQTFQTASETYGGYDAQIFSFFKIASSKFNIQRSGSSRIIRRFFPR